MKQEKACTLLIVALVALCSAVANAQQLTGSISGRFEVSQSGTATYSTTLPLPPGTAGMAPTLTLNYDSSAPSGLLGAGWSLGGLSAITRCPATHHEDGYIREIKFDSQDRFCLDGQKLVAVQGVYGADGTEYRTRIESFARIVSHGQSSAGPDFFTLEQKNGLRYEFGSAPAAQVRSQSSYVLSWSLNKVTDRQGNYYTVDYNQDPVNGFTMPAQISYTGNASAGLLPYHMVVFEYEQKTYGAVVYIGGARFSGSHRIKKITTYANGGAVNAFNLSYVSDAIMRQDRLLSIQECDASSLCLPATQFTWASQVSTAFGFNVPGPVLQDYLEHSNGTIRDHQADFNGDGRTDILREGDNPQQGQNRVFLSNGDGTFTAGPVISDFLSHSNETQRIHLGDFNADGKVDILREVDTLPVGANRVFFSNGDGTFNQGPSIFNTLGHSNHTIRSELGDFNGDGRTDILRTFDSPLTNANNVYFSNGDGTFVAGPTLSEYFSHSNGTIRTHLGDFNGDGRTDVLRETDTLGTGSNRVLFSNGDGTFSSGPQIFQTFGHSNKTIRSELGDFNGDGLTDILRTFDSPLTNANNIYFSRGDGTVVAGPVLSEYFSHSNGTIRTQLADFNGDGLTDVLREVDTVQTGANVVLFATGDGTFTTGPQIFQTFGHSNHTIRCKLGDFNGDGLADVLRTFDNAGLNLNQTYLSVGSIDRIVGIRNGFGEHIAITYVELTNPAVYTKTTGAQYPSVDLVLSENVVATIGISNGLGGQRRTHFHYAGLRYEHLRRAVLGFSRIDTSDEETGITSTVFYHQDYPYTGMSYRSERRLANGTLISSTESTWTAATFVNGTTFPYSSPTIERSYEIDGTLVSSATSTRTFDGYGNQIQSGITRSDGSSEITNNVYNNDVANWLLGQLLTSSVTKTGAGPNAPPAITRRTSYTYQNVSGLLLSETLEPGNALYTYSKSYQYDGYGNMVQTTVSGAGFASRTSSKTYDSRGQFAIGVTDALGHTENRQYDQRHGLATSVTGPNGITTASTYDGFGRAVSQTAADGTVTTMSYLPVDALSPANSAYRIQKLSTGMAPSIGYYDVLGREIRSETRGLNGQRVLSDKVYDNRGQVSQVSDPYFAGGTVRWTVSTYDDLGRVLSTTAPGNIVTGYVYSGLTSSVINNLGQMKSQRVDAQGQVVTTTDSLGAVLTFRRDSYGNLLQVTNPLGHLTTMTYDLAGRKLTMVDPDTGTSSYTYNKIGELVSQTNALGQTITYSYDLLGRMISRTRPEGTETWTYDVGFKAIGKLSSVTGLQGYGETYTYDSLGRPSRTTTFVGGKRYTFSQSYDTLGRLDVLSYPTGFGVRHQYNADGYLVAMRKMSDGSLLWRPDIRNAKGQVEQQTFGNTLVQNRQYDVNTGLLQRITTGTVQDLTFQFNSIGDLTQRQDVRIGATETFQYDNLNRLTSSQVTGQPAITAAYNGIGNITSRSDVGTYLYGANHKVLSIVGAKPATYTYDAAGNRTSGGGTTISYSSTGKPVSIVKGNIATQFDLDPSDQRIEERNYKGGGLYEKKVFINGGLYEHVENSGLGSDVHYVRGSEGLVAIYTTRTASDATTPSATMQYLLLDHLGSVQTITSSTGAAVEVQSYDSWGSRRDPLTWASVTTQPRSRVDRGYTGHEILEGVGLIHMNGRVYDPVIGRFISADPYVQDATNLQSYNRYSYVNNNPLSMTDPTGYFGKRFWRTARRVIRQAAPIAVAVVAAMAMQPWISAQVLCTTSTLYASAVVAGGGVATGMASSITGSLVNGQGLGAGLRDGLRSAPLNALAAYGAWEVGNAFSAGGSLYGTFGEASAGAKALAHGLVGGGTSVVGHGSFLSGFAAGMGGELAAGRGPVAAALAGGTAAAVSGGKFADGAMRGSFVYLFNACLHGQCESNALLLSRVGNPQQLADHTIDWARFNAEYGEVIDAFSQVGGVAEAALLIGTGTACLPLSLAVGGASLYTFLNDPNAIDGGLKVAEFALGRWARGASLGEGGLHRLEGSIKLKASALGFGNSAYRRSEQQRQMLRDINLNWDRG